MTRAEEISTRDYFERIIEEHKTALAVAEQEREKTAANVRRALEEMMKAGDERLQDHIDHQIEQVRHGLVTISNTFSERDLRFAEVRKFEESRFNEFKEFVNNKFEHANELRAALDDLQKLMATRRDLEAVNEKVLPLIDRVRDDIGKRLPSETFHFTLNEWTQWRTTMDKWKNEIAGRGEGISGTTRFIINAIGIIAVILGMVATFLAISNRTEINRNTDRIMQQAKP